MLHGKMLIQKCKTKWQKDNPGKCYTATKLAEKLGVIAKEMGLDEYAPTPKVVLYVERFDTSVTYHRARIFAEYVGIDIADIDTNNNLIKGQRNFLSKTTDKKKQTALELEEKRQRFLNLALDFLGAKSRPIGIGVVK